jgi:hypothetical protein
MKYIIPENKLDNIIFKYLDLNLKGLEKRKAKYHNGIVYGFPDEKFGILGYDNGDTLYIYYELINEIIEVFGLDNYDSELVIGKWFINRYQLDVTKLKLRAAGLYGVLTYQ